MTPEQYEAYLKYQAANPAPETTIPAPKPPTPAPTPAAPAPTHEEVAPAAPPKPKSIVSTAIESLNAQHNKTHNIFKCAGCRTDLAESLKGMGLDVRDNGDRIIIDDVPQVEGK